MEKTLPSNRKLAAKTRAVLEQRFPDVFVGRGVDKFPLRLGIHVDIKRACPELGTWTIKAALADYTHGPRYARCLVEGAPRIGLDGSPDGVVTAGNAAWAAKTLAGFEQQNAERKADAPHDDEKAAAA